MSAPSAGPRCPKCHRPLAAWRLDHCVYCGEAFPPELKDGHPEPETLRWVERPPLPPDVSKKLEMMKIVPIGGPRRRQPRSIAAGAMLLSVPVFGVLFYLLYGMLQKVSPGSGWFIFPVAVIFLAYVAWSVARSRR